VAKVSGNLRSKCTKHLGLINAFFAAWKLFSQSLDQYIVEFLCNKLFKEYNIELKFVIKRL